jgi:DHA2 family methylenomycin A resistance protein-like MFS transporter
LIPMALVFVVVSPFSGALQARLGTRFMTGGGVAIIGSGLLTVGVSAGSRSLLGAEIGLMLTGLGMGLATGPLTGLAVGAVAAARSGTAAALINVARMVGATLGVAALGAVFALLQGGTEGLRTAMLIGGGVQIVAAGLCWRAVPRAAN